MSEINFLNVFFDVESEYEVGFPITLTVFVLEGETIIISDPVEYMLFFIFDSKLSQKNSFLYLLKTYISIYFFIIT